jgi:hypothetical protein
MIGSSDQRSVFRVGAQRRRRAAEAKAPQIRAGAKRR